MLPWAALFGEHRRYRHGRYPRGPQDRLYLGWLCEALRWRVQILVRGDRERLVAVMAKHRGVAVSSSGQPPPETPAAADAGADQRMNRGAASVRFQFGLADFL
jgi:hypothetical protein